MFVEDLRTTRFGRKSIGIEKLTGEELRSQRALCHQMISLLAPSYENPTAIFAREFKHCSNAYLGYSSSGKLVCFYLVSFEAHIIRGDLRSTVYLGLSGTSEESKGSGAVAQLYKACLHDIKLHDLTLGKNSILWATTATPTAYLAAWKYLDGVEPRIDGTYSATGKEIVAAIRKHAGFPPPMVNSHPFLLRGVAYDTRYSVSEQRRIERVVARLRFSLFKDCGVDERNNDRLLFIAIPSEDR